MNNNMDINKLFCNNTLFVYLQILKYISIFRHVGMIEKYCVE
jgi:hypothetical protein